MVLLTIYGDIAQLIRAPALQAGGPGFESLYLHHYKHGVDWAFGPGHSTKIWAISSAG